VRAVGGGDEAPVPRAEQRTAPRMEGEQVFHTRQAQFAPLLVVQEVAEKVGVDDVELRQWEERSLDPAVKGAAQLVKAGTACWKDRAG
jgi:hypothetical protein